MLHYVYTMFIFLTVRTNEHRCCSYLFDIFCVLMILKNINL